MTVFIKSVLIYTISVDIGKSRLALFPSSVCVLIVLIEKKPIYNVNLNSETGYVVFENNDCYSCFLDTQNTVSLKILVGHGNCLILKVGGGQNMFED